MRDDRDSNAPPRCSLLRLARALALASLFVWGLTRHVAAQDGPITNDVGIVGWIAAHSRFVTRTPGVTHTFTTRAESVGHCRLLLTTADSMTAGPLQIVSEKTVNLDYGALQPDPAVVPLGSARLVHVRARGGHDLPVHTRLVIQGESRERNTRAAFVELIAPGPESAQRAVMLLQDAMTPCSPTIETVRSVATGIIRGPRHAVLAVPIQGLAQRDQAR